MELTGTFSGAPVEQSAALSDTGGVCSKGKRDKGPRRKESVREELFFI